MINLYTCNWGLEIKMVYGSFLGYKKICEIILNHPASKVKMSPILKNIANRFGFIFLRLFGYPLNPVERLRIRTVLSHIPVITHTRGNALDIGCSFGVLAFELSKNGYNVIGVDVNPESISLANEIRCMLKNQNITFLLEDFLQNKFQKNSFDVITLIEVLEHIKEDSEVIKKIFKILKKNGVFIVSVPYSKETGDLESPVLAVKTWYGKYVEIGVPGEHHYRHGYNLLRLSSLLKSNGFKIKNIAFTNYLSLLPKSLILFPLSFIIALSFSKYSKNHSKLTIVARKT